MQNVVTWHDVSVYHTCILHSVIYFLCALVQKRCYIVDAKDSEIQYFEVHITNSLQLLAAKVLLFSDICKFILHFTRYLYIFRKKASNRKTTGASAAKSKSRTTSNSRWTSLSSASEFKIRETL